MVGFEVNEEHFQDFGNVCRLYMINLGDNIIVKWM